MQGYIKLHRSLANHPLWEKEPFSRAQAWVDLLMLANHREGHVLVRGIRVDLKRGQVGWSEASLADRWMWSRTKTKRYLAYLESEHQIEQQKNNVSLIISITNYDLYQETEQQNGQQKSSKKSSRRAAEEQQKDTNKNDQEIEDPSDLPAAGKPPRERDPIWDATLELFGVESVAPGERTRFGKVVRDLRAKGATPEEMTLRHSRWGSVFPGATLTPEALVKHWDALRLAPTRRTMEIDGVQVSEEEFYAIQKRSRERHFERIKGKLPPWKKVEAASNV